METREPGRKLEQSSISRTIYLTSSEQHQHFVRMLLITSITSVSILLIALENILQLKLKKITTSSTWTSIKKTKDILIEHDK